MKNVLALPEGTELVGDFRIERVLGAGGFGMTYLAQETALGRQVTIKEYFPPEFAARGEGQSAVPRGDDTAADFQWGLDRFIDEAQALARFDHPNIVRVYRYFKANGTAYMVLSFEEGESLKGWLGALKRAPRQRELDDILAPLLDALETVHAADFLHRDIAPDNIIIRKDGTPVMIDFGSARGEIAARTRTVSALVKPGYSPYEQYAEIGARQGPWTDIYALGATLYQAISGRRPADSPSRVVKDELAPAEAVALASYRPRFLAAIDRALLLDPGSRPQSVAAWRGDLLAPDPARAGWLERASGRVAPGRRSDAATVKLTVQPGGVPIPDAPGAPGQILDLIDDLKQKSAAAAPGVLERLDAVASSSRAQSLPKQQAEKSKPSAARSQPKPSRPEAPARSAERLPVAAPPKNRPARPRPMRSGRALQWRAFAIKFAIGAAIAGAAIAYQDELAGFARVVDGGSERGTEIVEKASLARVATAAPQPTRLTMLAGHRGPVNAVGFTADGRRIVTAGADGTLRVWNALSGAQVRTIEPAEGVATAMSVSGQRVVTGHADGRAALWDLETGQRIATYRRGDAAVTAVGFSRDGERVVVSSSDATVTIWDATSPQSPVALVEAHDGPVTAVAYAERGQLIATGGEDNAVRLWRARDLKLVRSYKGHRDVVTALAFSPQGRYVAAGAEDGRIRVWSTSSSSLYRLNSRHKGRIRGLAFSPAGDLLASAADDGSVQLWHLRQSKIVRASQDGGMPPRALAFAPDGSRAAVASADGSVRFWDAALPGRQSR